MKLKVLVPVLCGLPLLLLASMAPARADEEGAQLSTLVDQRSPTIVTVKVVLKISAGAGSAGENAQETTTEMEGVVVTPDGLVMISNRSISPDLSNMAPGLDLSGFKMTPQSFKVVLGRDGKQYDAFMAATDSTLGLAFVKTVNVGDRPIPFVDFSQSVKPGMGETVAVVSRLLKGFDYAPIFETARISGSVTRPRPAWTLNGTVSELGLPVYNLAGAPAGVLTTIAPSATDASDQAAMGMTTFLRMLTGGGLLRSFVIPGAVVQDVIARAVKQAASVAAARAASGAPAAAPAPTTPAAPAPPRH